MNDINQHTVKELRAIITSIKKIIAILDKKYIFGQEKRETYFFDNHNDIMSKFPFLVSQLCSNDNNNDNMIDIMLRHIEEVELGEKTKEQSDIIIGDKLANNFIKK